MLIEDFYKHCDNLKDFENWSGRLYRDGHANQIDDVALSNDGFHALQQVLRPYQQHREEKRLQNEFRRLSADDKKRIEDGTTPLYEGAEGRVLMIHNWEASKFWGTHTEWCITQKDTDQHFYSYHGDSPIIFYLPHPSAADIKTHPDEQSFKFAAVDGHLWNEHDKVTTSKFPECLHKLAFALRDHYAADDECTRFLKGHAHVTTIADDCINIELGEAVSAIPATPEHSSQDVDYDDFDSVINVLNSDVEHAYYHFKQSSDQLKQDPAFLLAALDVERRTASIGNAASPRPRDTETFKRLLRDDRAFMEQALKTYGKVYHDLPRALRAQEGIALMSLARHPIGIIKILDNTTVINDMYSGDEHRRMKTPEKRMKFLTKAMQVNPSVATFVENYTDIDISSIPDQAWLAAFDAEPRLFVIHFQHQRAWFERYCRQYKGDDNDPHSPRELIIRSFRDIDKGDKPTAALFSVLEAVQLHVFTDPEVLSLCVVYAHSWFGRDIAEHYPKTSEIYMQAVKHNLECFHLFSAEQRADPKIIGEVLRHVIATNQQTRFARHLRHLPFSSPKHPVTLMSCAAVKRVTDRLSPDGFEWPNFQTLIDDYRSLRADPCPPPVNAYGANKRGMTP